LSSPQCVKTITPWDSSSTAGHMYLLLENAAGKSNVLLVMSCPDIRYGSARKLCATGRDGYSAWRGGCWLNRRVSKEYISGKAGCKILICLYGGITSSIFSFAMVEEKVSTVERTIRKLWKLCNKERSGVGRTRNELMR
jgi:hypothetical protein